MRTHPEGGHLTMANFGERTWAWLRDEAKRTKRDVQALAISYTIERFMERLMRHDNGCLVSVKGGQSLGIVFGNEMRPTKDLDINISLPENETDVDALREQATELARLACEDPAEDGVTYDVNGLKTEILKQQGAGGLRISIPASIHTCKVDFVIDVGLDNEMSFDPDMIRVDGILAKRKEPPAAADIRIYPIENTIAEKLACKIEDGPLSIRHKDFYDIWLLMETALRVGDLALPDAEDEELLPMVDRMRLSAVRQGLADGTLLELPEIGINEQCMERIAIAIQRTFKHRDTEVPDDIVELLKEDFSEDRKQATQWSNWCRNNAKRLRFTPPGAEEGADKGAALATLIERLSPFLSDLQAHIRKMENTPVPF